MSTFQLKSALKSNESTTTLNSQIDVIFTNIKNAVVGSYETFFSDHKPIYFYETNDDDQKVEDEIIETLTESMNQLLNNFSVEEDSLHDSNINNMPYINKNISAATDNGNYITISDDDIHDEYLVIDNNNKSRIIVNEQNITSFEQIENFVMNYNFQETILRLDNDKILLRKKDFLTLLVKLNNTIKYQIKEKFNVGWLTDSIVEAFNYKLTQEYNHLGAGDLVLFSLLSHNSNLNEILPNYNIAKSHFILPFNIHGNHWTLFAVNLHSGHYFYLDPMGEKPCRLVNELICRLLQYFPTKPWKYIETDPTIQTDGYNCGSFICWYAEQFAKNLTFVDNNFEANLYRIYIFNKIIS